jgi:inorganic triphosphatase YgiF
MEIELKMAFTSADGPTLLWQNPWVRARLLTEPEITLMNATYLDTEDRRLQAAGIVYRVRQEGSLPVATVKYGEIGEQGITQRQEENIVLTDGREGYPYPVSRIFASSAAGEKLLNILGQEALGEIFRTEFSRQHAHLLYEGLEVELAADVGLILAGTRSEVISELEAEIISGSIAQLAALQEELAGRLPLQAEPRSKYARGLRLASSVAG